MTYTRELVEHLLPTVWDISYAYGMANPTAPDPDMPRAAVNPAHSGTLNAHLVDIKTAWGRAPLTLDERRAAYLRYAIDCTHAEIALIHLVDKSTALRRCERAVGKLADWLNGDETEDDED